MRRALQSGQRGETWKARPEWVWRVLRSCYGDGRRATGPAAYLEQVKMTIDLAGAVEPDDLTPEGRAELSDLYRRWRFG
jgi:hypothetical protein